MINKTAGVNLNKPNSTRRLMSHTNTNTHTQTHTHIDNKLAKLW